MKVHTVTVIQSPAPVLPAHIEVSTAYIVIRGDGMTKVFDTLHGGDYSMWQTLSMQYGPKLKPDTILIPLDMFSAVRLGLVTVDELELPEGAKALINIIK